MPNGEQSLPSVAIDLVLENLSINLERFTTRSAKRFTIEWFKVTCSRGVEYQQMFFQKILRNPIWHDVLLNLKDLENVQNTVQSLSKGW